MYRNNILSCYFPLYRPPLPLFYTCVEFSIVIIILDCSIIIILYYIMAGMVILQFLCKKQKQKKSNNAMHTKGVHHKSNFGGCSASQIRVGCSTNRPKSV